MITRETAQQLAVDYIKEVIQPRCGMEIALSALGEHATCWVAVYTSKAFLETGSHEHALAGNGPLIINRRTGAIRRGRSALPVEDQLDPE